MNNAAISRDRISDILSQALAEGDRHLVYLCRMALAGASGFAARVADVTHLRDYYGSPIRVLS